MMMEQIYHYRSELSRMWERGWGWQDGHERYSCGLSATATGRPSPRCAILFPGTITEVCGGHGLWLRQLTSSISSSILTCLGADLPSRSIASASFTSPHGFNKECPLRRLPRSPASHWLKYTRR